MKAAIYNQYLDTLGGGERYTIEFAIVLAKNGYEVDVEWDDPKILSIIAKRFGFKLPKNIKIVSSIQKGKDYDLCFWVSDGSIPNLLARRNFIHFQVPFKDVGGRSLINKMKLFKVEKVICNSNFTKKIVDEEFGVDSFCLYPPIDVVSFRPRRKEKLIIYVGRFSNLLQSKGQEVLIEQFKKLCGLGISDYKLVLAGGVEVGSEKYLSKLEKLVDNYPIEIIKSPSFSKLKELYGKSKIFWSASGYGVDENLNPHQVEHFGMTLVEAMSAGCVPVVSSVGGHKEIISDKIDGFLWNNSNELIEITNQLLTVKGFAYKISKESISKSKKFAISEFEKKVLQIIR